MAKFIVRVQLSNPTLNNYTILKNALIKAGLTKKVKATDGKEYTLPNGNYLAESTTNTTMEVLRIVLGVCQRVGDKEAQVLVTKVAKEDGMAWANL